MSTVANAPIIQAVFNEQKTKRQERRLFAAPLSELSEVDHVVIDVALNSVVAEDSVLPREIEQKLMMSTNYFYQVTDYKGKTNYNTLILVIFDGTFSKIKIYMYDKIAQVYTVKSFNVVVPVITNKFITRNLTKVEYNEKSIHLNKESVFQYGVNLLPLYSLLFHVVFQTDFIEPPIANNVAMDLSNLLNDTEITLHLNLTQTVKLYGEVDKENFLVLYIREIGSPDTYWSRMVLLSELLDRSLR